MVTTGTFDGVHIGHQSILRRLKEIAHEVKGETVLLTFWPHPRQVLYNDQDLRLIQTLEERQEKLAEVGVDHLIIHPFTKDFSRLTSLEFIRDQLVNGIHTHRLVIGYNHQFGRNREGSFEHLKEYAPVYGFEVEEISAQDIDQVNVSSTKIREALAKGDILTANQYLGDPFRISGQVVKGDQIGRTLGYPTANIEIPESYKLIPSQGVYAVKVLIEGFAYKGMLNIGNRPTLNGTDQRIEVHLFDFNKDIYNKWVRIEFVDFLREDVKFDSLNELKNQLSIDAEQAKSRF